jgi:hypothetical protein
MITVTINTTRGGTVSAPFAALATERITFQGDIIPGDNTTLAILDEHGGTIAQGRIVGAEADLDLNTCQADEATRYADPGEPVRAYVAVGDTDNLLAVIPCQLVRNALDNIAPPTELAPTYPTSDSLLAILAQMTAQANRAEEAVEATEKAQKAVAEYVDNTFPTKVTEAEERLENATDEAVRKIGNEAQDATSTISKQATSVTYSLSEAQKTILGNIDTKAQAVSTALDGKVEQANQAKDDAIKAKTEAEIAKTQAEGFRDEAQTSAEQASTSAQQAEDAKNAIGDVGGRLEAMETSVADALPYSLEGYGYNVKAWLGQEESNILSVGGVVPAPIGFIATHGTKNPYARREVVWIKPNGERIKILTRENDLTNHPWLNYNNTTHRAMWLDGDYVYIVTTSNSVTYKTSIHFVNGEPKDIVSASVADSDLTSTPITAYSIKIADNFVIASNGQIFNAETLKVASTVTLATSRLVTASNAQGVYAMTSQGVVLITVDESGSPIITVKSSSKKYLPLASGKFVKGTFSTNAGWAKMFACEGGLSNSINDSIAGNVVPALMNADIGIFVVNPFALYQVCSYGTSGGAVGYTMPIVRFPRSPKIYEGTQPSIAVKSGDNILILVEHNYILITKEALV